MDGPERNDDPPPQERPSALERLRRARRWFWQSWTDEAVLVYRRAARGKDKAQIRMVELFLFVRELYRDFWRTEVTARAASLAYTTLLSLIPLLIALSQQLAGWFEASLPSLQSRLDQFLNIVLPYESAEFAHHINEFLLRADTSPISGIGGLVFLLISFRLFMAVEGAFNQIWRVETVRGYRQRLRTFTMILFWGPVLIGLSFTMVVSLENEPYVSGLLTNPVVLRIFPFFALFVGFTMLFWLVPSTRVRLQAAMVGAAAAAISFELVRAGFAIYASALFEGRINAIYGTLGLFLVFLISVELMWVVILLGVTVSYVYQNLQGILRASEQQLDESPTYDLYFALRGIVEVARRFEQWEDAPSSYRLAEEFGATDAQMLRVLRKLEATGLVKEIRGEWTGYVPGCDPDRISVEELIQEMEGGTRDIPPAATESAERDAVEGIFATVRTSTREALNRLTVGQFVRQLYGPRKPSRSADYLPTARES